MPSFSDLETMLLAATAKTQPPYTTIPQDFGALIGPAITYAEGRIYKELVLLGTRAQNVTVTVASSRSIDLTQLTDVFGNPATVLTVEGLSLYTQLSPGPGVTRVPFDAASLDVIDLVWPVETVTVAPNITDFSPRYWAMRDATTIVLCPTPDAAYTAEITGIFQPAPLSSSNPTTYLFTTYPELVEAACMVFLCGALLHNYGSQADNPARAMSWEDQFGKLLMLAKDEEARRRGLRPNVQPMPRPAAPPGGPA